MSSRTEDEVSNERRTPQSFRRITEIIVFFHNLKCQISKRCDSQNCHEHVYFDWKSLLLVLVSLINSTPHFLTYFFNYLLKRIISRDWNNIIYKIFPICIEYFTILLLIVSKRNFPVIRLPSVPEHHVARWKTFLLEWEFLARVLENGSTLTKISTGEKSTVRFIYHCRELNRLVAFQINVSSKTWSQTRNEKFVSTRTFLQHFNFH